MKTVNMLVKLKGDQEYTESHHSITMKWIKDILKHNDYHLFDKHILSSNECHYISELIYECTDRMIGDILFENGKINLSLVQGYASASFLIYLKYISGYDWTNYDDNYFADYIHSMTENSVSTQNIIECEKDILKEYNWNLFIPTKKKGEIKFEKDIKKLFVIINTDEEEKKYFKKDVIWDKLKEMNKKVWKIKRREKSVKKMLRRKKRRKILKLNHSHLKFVKLLVPTLGVFFKPLSHGL